MFCQNRELKVRKQLVLNRNYVTGIFRNMLRVLIKVIYLDLNSSPPMQTELWASNMTDVFSSH